MQRLLTINVMNYVLILITNQIQSRPPSDLSVCIWWLHSILRQLDISLLVARRTVKLTSADSCRIVGLFPGIVYVILT